MDGRELLEIVARGEDARRKFQVHVPNDLSLAAEFAAFANSGGGQMFIGVTDDGHVSGHNVASVARLNPLISTAASNSLRPPLSVHTENVQVSGAIVVVVTVPDGLSKPYMDNAGAIWVKSGSDKRRVTAREEMQRMFQRALLVHGDDVAIPGSSVDDIDTEYVRRFFKARFDQELDEQDVPLAQILSNMRLLSGDLLTVSGALLFARDPSPLLPAFHVKAVCYPGADIHSEVYIDSSDILGRLQTQFESALAFILRNLRQAQGDQGINSIGLPEVPRIVFEELVANALIHRDYFVSAPVRIFVFDDRVEIISPGHLPNSLTVANIKSGNSNIRNPILASYATRLLPYRGLGSGIVRALREYPHIEFVDDRDGNKFTAVVRRPGPSV